eukprot:791819-Prymnesium_polylepis.1
MLLNTPACSDVAPGGWGPPGGMGGGSSSSSMPAEPLPAARLYHKFTLRMSVKLHVNQPRNT